METGSVSEPEPPTSLRDVLEQSRRLGFLGPGEVEFHVKHSLGFAATWDHDRDPVGAVDLGSGGGVPGLVLASMVWPSTRWILIDSAERRCAFLREAADELRLTDRVSVHRDRAEVAGLVPHLRHEMDLVVARSFGPPPVAAECGSPFLRVEGRLIVSEPPEEPAHERWPEAGLSELGLRRLDPLVATEHRYALLAQEELCGDRYPRATGRPSKRPLF